MITVEPPTAIPVVRDAESLWSHLRSDRRFVVGTVLAVLVVVLAVLGPWLAPHEAGEYVGAPLTLPGSGHPLGTDSVGHDVLSLVLRGGWAFLLQGLIATALGVTGGAVVGMLLGVSGRRAQGALSTVNDTVILLPQILVALLVMTRLGTGPVILTLVVAFAHVFHTSRVVRVATARVAGEDFVLAARGSGSGGARLVLREVVPNIAAAGLVEFGLRLSASYVLIASLAYLGFGGSSIDWGRMVQENQGGLAVQPWAVVVPVLCLSAFLVGVNLGRDALARALAVRSSM
ncbi:peptide/nickel transport system permease protein [Micromonospora pallida]|uniref:Peptide/nickel transport system permease protein n=1 Tax=Micromonospora pallida TaxID=145854 RepID=A0A1C6RSF3_9ACTN|nr:ABC transporter permease [Micromonospora pallida]SCL20004.1 peptide/nickel transport system permease protein [Micromonospora pallida]